jgi:hypothetical protein
MINPFIAYLAAETKLVDMKRSIDILNESKQKKVGEKRPEKNKLLALATSCTVCMCGVKNVTHPVRKKFSIS